MAILMHVYNNIILILVHIPLTSTTLHYAVIGQLLIELHYHNPLGGMSESCENLLSHPWEFKLTGA